jgi:hypothetical protein
MLPKPEIEKKYAKGSQKSLSSNNGKGDKSRITNFHKYQENWPLGSPRREIHSNQMRPDAAIRCEYHDYGKNGYCTRCGQMRPIKGGILILGNGDQTHEMVEILEDGGGTRLVHPTELPDYPRDGE